MTMPKGWTLPADNEDPNTKTLEEKKWLVQRFDVGLRSLTSELTVARETFKSRVSRIEMSIKDWRNAILAAVTFVAATIFGISSGYPSEIQAYRQWIILILTTDVFIGIAAFIILSILRERAYSLIRSSEGSILFSLHRMYFLENYFNRGIVPIHEVSIKRLEFFVNYLPFRLKA